MGMVNECANQLQMRVKPSRRWRPIIPGGTGESGEWRGRSCKLSPSCRKRAKAWSNIDVKTIIYSSLIKIVSDILLVALQQFLLNQRDGRGYYKSYHPFHDIADPNVHE